MLKSWLLSFLGWGILASLLVGQFAFAVNMPWVEALRIAGRDWLPWAIVTPPIFWLVARLPLERERWKVALPVNIACALVTIAFCGWWGQTVLPPNRNFRGFQRPESRPAEAASTTPAISRPQSRPQRPPGPPGGKWGPFGWFGMVGFRLPIYFAVASAAHAFLFYRRSQERERRALELTAGLAQARLEALRMQLQPHFLFNALNAIAALVHKDPEAADEMLGALSDLLRLTLETSGEQELPLRREQQLMERYLAIEKVRFGDRLQFVTDIQPDTQAALVPAFLLQPLVENAVRHGLEPRPCPGQLEVRAYREGSTLHITVKDDGVGLPKEAPLREGIGLANTRARLRELYGDAARMELNSDHGLTVAISLPYRTAK